MDIHGMKENLDEIDRLLADHKQEKTEIIAAHSILPILRDMQQYMLDTEIEYQQESSDDQGDEDEKQLVWTSVSLYSSLQHHLWSTLANDDLRELMPDYFGNTLRLACELQAEIDGVEPRDVLITKITEIPAIHAFMENEGQANLDAIVAEGQEALTVVPDADEVPGQASQPEEAGAPDEAPQGQEGQEDQKGEEPVA